MKSTILATGFLTSCSTVNNVIGNTENTNNNSMLGKWELSQINFMKAGSIAEAYPMGTPYLNFISSMSLKAINYVHKKVTKSTKKEDISVFFIIL